MKLRWYILVITFVLVIAQENDRNEGKGGEGDRDRDDGNQHDQDADMYDGEDDTVESSTPPIILNFEDLGGVPFLQDEASEWRNGALLNQTLNSLSEGAVFVIPNKTFYAMGGILVTAELNRVKIQLLGTLVFSPSTAQWPRDAYNGHVLEALCFSSLENSVFTSGDDASSRGTLEGNGAVWWDVQHITNDRPRLLNVHSSRNMTVEKWRFLDSPFWSVFLQNSNGLTIRYCEAFVQGMYTGNDGDTQSFLTRIVTRVWLWLFSRFRYVSWLRRIFSFTAVNTDGFDVSGNDIHGHDLTIGVADDAIAVKGSSSNVLFERLTITSGLGLAIGSVTRGETVHNVTFRDAVLKNSVKGIYIKTQTQTANANTNANGGNDYHYYPSISDVVYSNITIVEPLQFGIWIGPNQMQGSGCSLDWPFRQVASCYASPSLLSNITLRQITIVDPFFSPGVVMGSNSSTSSTSGVEIVFDSVNVVSRYSRRMDPTLRPWGLNYYCQGFNVRGVAVNSHPVPPCFDDDAAVTTSLVGYAAAAFSFAMAAAV